ncbi:MAG: ABC transporter permease [Eubacteriales bacterium]
MKKPTLLGRLSVGLLFLFLYAPIFVLMIFSFNEANSRTVWGGFSFKWYAELFDNRDIMSSLGTTFLVAMVSTIVATIMGTFAAIGFHNMRRRYRKPLMTINDVPLMNADIVTGVSLAMFLVAFMALIREVSAWTNEISGGFLPKLEPTTGIITLIIAHISFNIPYVILSVMPRLRQMDKHLLDAAQDLGCTWFQAFIRVILPELKPGIINGMLIAFTMSVDDFVISFFTAGSSVSTLSMQIYAMTKRKISPEINAISTLLFVTVLLLLVIINLREVKQSTHKRSPQNS